jgi:transcriptional regulator with XRE-family HTH domain
MAELENRWLDLGEFIREQRRIGELSLRKLSEMAGISNPYLSQIERGLRKPSAEILQQIARALEISSETLYVRAGILDDEREHDLITEVRRDPTLREDQKKAMISIYESFRTENAVKAAQLAAEMGEAVDDEDDGSDASDGAVEAVDASDAPEADDPLDAAVIDAAVEPAAVEPAAVEPAATEPAVAEPAAVDEVAPESLVER